MIQSRSNWYAKFSYPDYKFNTHYCGDDLFFALWTGQLIIVDFSVITPTFLIPWPSKGEILESRVNNREKLSIINSC